MNTAINIELIEQLHNAIAWESTEESEDGIDYTYRAFMNVMLYRKKIAIAIIEEINEINKKVLWENFNYCNDQIKKLLGL